MDPTQKFQFQIKANWLTRKPNDWALGSSLLLAVAVVVLSYFYWNGWYGATEGMGANGEAVFRNSQYWRLWSTLFVHADMEHLLSNLILLVPLSFLLTGYFGLFVFPFMGLAMGGLINVIVLKNMPATAGIIGISGLVYWMGAVWLTLFILVDRRQRMRRRLAIGLFLSVILFIPETYHPEISYLSHFVGYVLGFGFALAYYFLKRHEFKAAEMVERVFEDPVLSELDKQALAAGILAASAPTESIPDVVPLPKPGI